jgi:hypothetical protein
MREKILEMKLLHADGNTTEIFLSNFPKSLSLEAIVWWMTETDRVSHVAESQLKQLSQDLNHPQRHLIAELVAWRTKERIIRK